MVPSAIDGFAGVTASDSSTAAVTVNVVAPDSDPEVAVMFAAPVPTLLAKPPLLIVATVAVSELHCALAVMSWVVPLVNVPVAANC